VSFALLFLRRYALNAEEKGLSCVPETREEEEEEEGGGRGGGGAISRVMLLLLFLCVLLHDLSLKKKVGTGLGWGGEGDLSPAVLASSFGGHGENLPA